MSSRLPHCYAQLLSRFVGRTAMTCHYLLRSTLLMPPNSVFQPGIIEAEAGAFIPLSAIPDFIILTVAAPMLGEVLTVAHITGAPGSTFVAMATCRLGSNLFGDKSLPIPREIH